MTLIAAETAIVQPVSFRRDAPLIDSHRSLFAAAQPGRYREIDERLPAFWTIGAVNALVRVRCDCGVEIVSTQVEDLVARARQHARRDHDMNVPVERILAMIEPCGATFAPLPDPREADPDGRARA